MRSKRRYGGSLTMMMSITSGSGLDHEISWQQQRKTYNMN